VKILMNVPRIPMTVLVMQPALTLVDPTPASAKKDMREMAKSVCLVEHVPIFPKIVVEKKDTARKTRTEMQFASVAKDTRNMAPENAMANSAATNARTSMSVKTRKTDVLQMHIAETPEAVTDAHARRTLKEMELLALQSAYVIESQASVDVVNAKETTDHTNASAPRDGPLMERHAPTSMNAPYHPDQSGLPSVRMPCAKISALDTNASVSMGISD